MKNNSIDYGKTIRELRKKYKMTQSELAEKIKMGKTSISNYETGYSLPSATILEKLSEVFDMSFADFINYGCKTIDELNMPRLSQPINDTLIPYIKEANICSNILSVDNYMDSYLTVPGFMLDTNAAYVCIKMPDDSMESEHIHKNDYIIVRKSTEIKNNKLVLALYNPENTYIVRRFIRDGHIASLIPCSIYSKYDIIRADERDGDVTIIGYIEKIISSVK